MMMMMIYNDTHNKKTHVAQIGHYRDGFFVTAGVPKIPVFSDFDYTIMEHIF